MDNDTENHDIARLLRLQAEADRGNAPPPTIRDYLTPAAATNQRDDLNQRIIRTYERLRKHVNDVATDVRIYAKVARALEEGRIPEGEIAAILACIDMARNRGAYFVAAAKKCFTRNHLSWKTEEWR